MSLSDHENLLTWRVRYVRCKKIHTTKIKNGLERLQVRDYSHKLQYQKTSWLAGQMCEAGHRGLAHRCLQEQGRQPMPTRLEQSLEYKERQPANLGQRLIRSGLHSVSQFAADTGNTRSREVSNVNDCKGYSNMSAAIVSWSAKADAGLGMKGSKMFGARVFVYLMLGPDHSIKSINAYGHANNCSDCKNTFVLKLHTG